MKLSIVGLTVFSAWALFVTPAYAVEGSVKTEIQKESADFLKTESIRLSNIGCKLLSGLPERGDGFREAALPFTFSSIEKEPVIIGGLIPFFNSSLDIHSGDKLIKYQGMGVNSEDELQRFLFQTKDVSEVTIRLDRSGREWDQIVPISYFPYAPRFAVTGKNGEAYSEWVNGEITVSAALLRMVEGESELAYILAHEIAHGTRGHYRTEVYDAAGNATSYAIASLITRAIAPGTTPMAYQQSYLIGPYLEKDEIDADYTALGYMGLLGYDPNAAYNFLVKEESEIKASSKDSIRGIHPLSIDRIALVKKRLAVIPEQQTGVSSLPASAALPKKAEFEKLGIDLSVGTDPEASKISNIGLAESRVYRFGVDSDLKDDALVFLSTTKRIVWHAEDKNTNPFEYRVCEVVWHRPDGSVYRTGKTSRDMDNKLVDGISLKEEDSDKNIGRWRVRVTLGQKVVDERYFMVKSARADIKIRRSELLKNRDSK